MIFRNVVFELLKRVLLFNFWVKTLRVRRQLIDKVDFWLGVVLNPIFGVLAILSLLSLWGVSTDLLLQSMRKILFGFKVGGWRSRCCQFCSASASFCFSQRDQDFAPQTV